MSNGPAAYAASQQNRKDQMFQNMLNMFYMSKQLKQRKEQQGWERKYQQRGQDIQQQRADDYGAYTRRPPTPKTQPEWMQKAMIISQREGIPISDVVKRMVYGKPTDPSVASDKAKTAAEAKRKKSLSQIKTAYGRVQKRIDKLEKPFSQTELIAGAMTGNFRDVEIDQNALLNLNLVKGELAKLESKASHENLTPEEQRRVDRIFGNLARIEKKGPYWDKTAAKSVDKEAVEKKFEYNGSVREKNVPVGTQVFVDKQGGEYVQISGVWKKLVK